MVLCDPKAINCFWFHDRVPCICDATHIDKGQLSRYFSKIHQAFIYIICKQKICVMNLIHICAAWQLWINMKLLVAKMSIEFICLYIASTYLSIYLSISFLAKSLCFYTIRSITMFLKVLNKVNFSVFTHT